LLVNFPNPFNPETWLPYQLAESNPVTITIYNVNGESVRTLLLGFKTSGHYLTKDKAAHWDGRNTTGESVASGVYFYTLRAGEFIATRKMLIVK
jgi:flagellar hook assembly protein FlgD